MYPWIRDILPPFLAYVQTHTIHLFLQLSTKIHVYLSLSGETHHQFWHS
jgi:hypothetical protein